METFVVRVWRPGDRDWSPGVRGTASHLASGRQVTFTDADALLAFLSEVVASGGSDAVEETQSPSTSTSHVRH